MHGVLNLLKPPGMTSHDAVAFVRRTTGIKRVGHTGTLDPAAAGVLPVCIGQATRLVEYLQAGRKTYIAEITFGHETDTLDTVGKTVAQADASHVTLESLRAALNPFRGTISQTPPLYSAIKQGGVKLYELARQGAQDVQIPLRQVVIHRLFVTRFVEAADAAPPRAMLHIECGSGTYIRSLVRDIGRALGVFATMTFLVRTQNGGFDLDDAHTIEEVAHDARAAILPLQQVLTWCARRVVVNDKATRHLAQGRTAHFSEAERAGSNEYAADPDAAKERKTQAWRNASDCPLVLFTDSAGTTAALARLAPSAEHIYEPQKVFHLDALAQDALADGAPVD